VTEGSPPSRLWGGRFREPFAPDADRLNRSLPVDRRLWRQDIAVAGAWAVALSEAGVLTPAEGDRLVAGLEAVRARLAGWSGADWEAAEDEDIHTLVERLLHGEVGGLAGKLATGRSRNDQVATTTRLWAMAAVASLHGALRELQVALLDQARAHVGTVMPSYTHLQRAQPISAAHWLMSHFWPLVRDRARLSEASRRAAVLPLGAGAIAGCPYPVDRVRLAEALGFAEPAPNSMDAVADRDFVAELLFAIAMIGTHLSRLGEDIIIFASSEFGYIRLPDRYSTGSSLMPQKRNPDVMELARGKAGRLVGELVGWLGVLKGLPSGYNKDLQEDKAALFASFDALSVLVPAVAGTVRELAIDEAACEAGVDPGMLATDLADSLVAEGVPFREAHEQVGALIRVAEELGCSLDAVPEARLRAISTALAAIDLRTELDARASLARRAALGGTAPVAVEEQLRAAADRL
jgi:argininosuccinate lyase